MGARYATRVNPHGLPVIPQPENECAPEQTDLAAPCRRVRLAGAGAFVPALQPSPPFIAVKSREAFSFETQKRVHCQVKKLQLQ